MDTTLRGVSDLFIGQELGLKTSSEWTRELWNALQNESVEDKTIIPLVTIWLGGYDCSPVICTDVSLIRILLLSCVL